MATTPYTKMDTLLKKLGPGNFSNYKDFIRALLIEALANTEFTFDELNYNLYALNKEIFNQLNKETTAFFKFLHRTPDVDYKMKEWLAWVPLNTAFFWKEHGHPFQLYRTFQSTRVSWLFASHYFRSHLAS